MTWGQDSGLRSYTNQVLNLCKIIGVKRDNCVKCWFWLGFKERFSQVSNFIHWVGSLGTLLWVLDSYLRDPFVNPQVFYALLPCVVQNSNDSFWHLKTKEILNFLFIYMLYCIFLCFEREHWKIFSFITHAPGHQLVEEFAGLLKRIDDICK